MNSLQKADPQSTRIVAITLIEGSLREKAENLPTELLELDLHDLEARCKFTETDYFLKKRLWELITEREDEPESPPIRGIDIYKGICTLQNFHRRLDSPIRVAWFLHDARNDIKRLEAGLPIAISNLLNFIAQPITEKTATAFLRALDMMLSRTHGPVIQRVDARHAHVNLNKPIDQSNIEVEQLKEMRERLLGASQSTTTTIIEAGEAEAREVNKG